MISLILKRKKGDDGCELIALPMGGKKGTFENEMEIKEGGLDETTEREKDENFPSGRATNDPVSMVESAKKGE